MWGFNKVFILNVHVHIWFMTIKKWLIRMYSINKHKISKTKMTMIYVTKSQILSVYIRWQEIECNAMEPKYYETSYKGTRCTLSNFEYRGTIVMESYETLLLKIKISESNFL